jgi:hypothetical protein
VEKKRRERQGDEEGMEVGGRRSNKGQQKE